MTEGFLKPNAKTDFSKLFSVIKVEHTLKYLGVILDDKLTFGDHIKILVNKVARGVGILTKLEHFFPQNILLQLYYTLVHSQLLYGIIIWGNTFPTYMRKLTALQNRAVKVISRAHFRNSVKSL